MVNSEWRREGRGQERRSEKCKVKSVKLWDPKKSQKNTTFRPVFYGSTMSRMRFRPHKPPFFTKPPKKFPPNSPLLKFPTFKTLNSILHCQVSTLGYYNMKLSSPQYYFLDKGFLIFSISPARAGGLVVLPFRNSN